MLIDERGNQPTAHLSTTRIITRNMGKSELLPMQGGNKCRIMIACIILLAHMVRRGRGLAPEKNGGIESIL